MTKVNDEAIRTILHGKRWRVERCRPLLPITLALWMVVCAMAYLRG